MVGLAIAARRDFALDYGRGLDDLAGLLWPDDRRRLRSGRIRDAFKRDIRTYKPPDFGRTCTAPMQRRDGLCGRSAQVRFYLTDWATGEMRYCGGCSRHGDWADAQHGANRLAKPADPPLPYANHGGALRVHFPEFAWRSFWRQLDPRWVEHPEGTVWPKPTLRLVLGDGDDEGSDRPLLTAVGQFGPRPQETP
jgi:hypothetical protein